MKNWYDEAYSFIITVAAVGTDGNAQHCRNGHEPEDSYSCQYGCPMPLQGEGSFCAKSMLKLFPLLEAIRAGGNLSHLLAGAERHKGIFSCPDGVVTFLLEATQPEQIK